MKELSKSITLGEGLGDLHFGMIREVFRKIAGEPDEIEGYQHTEINDERAEAWHYDEPAVSFAFEEFNNWKLTSIAISAPGYLIEGTDLFGQTRDEVINTIKRLNLGSFDEEDFSDEENPDLKIISIPDKGLNLWLDAGAISEIQFSQIWEDEE